MLMGLRINLDYSMLLLKID